MTNKIFVYGTLKRGYNMERLVPDAKFIRETILFGYDIYDLGSYPGIKVAEQSDEHYPFVRGELWQVSDEGLARLDQYEGSAYEKIMVAVEGEEVDTCECAITYLFIGSVSQLKPLVNGKWDR